jgi:hypothetical protein
VRLGVVLPAGAGGIYLAQLCDRIGIDVLWASDEASAAAVRAVVTSIAVAVKPGTDEPWAKTVAVSLGRTRVEAAARASLDPRLEAFAEDARIFGSLEDCQARVASYRDGGVTDLRCVLPDTPDVTDVLAQLTAIAYAPR